MIHMDYIIRGTEETDRGLKLLVGIDGFPTAYALYLTAYRSALPVKGEHLISDRDRNEYPARYFIGDRHYQMVTDNTLEEL